MGQPTAPIPDFDDTRPWGAYRPTAAVAALLAVAHRLPPALAGLAKPLRRKVKYDLATPLDITVWGLKLRLLPRGNISEQKLYTAPQLFDRDEFVLIAQWLKPGGVFVDVGANAGIYSFWAHHCMGGRGRIVAVEPDPEMRRRLGFNLRSNGIDAIEVCPVALSDREGSAELQVNPQQRGENSLETAPSSGVSGARQLLTVPLTTLHALLAARGIDRVDVLKIDIEGHEPPVLRHFFAHAPQTLWPRAVITEFKSQTAGALRGMLEASGYRLRATTRLNFVFER